MLINLPCSLCNFPLGEDKQDVCGAPSGVCLQFSPSQLRMGISTRELFLNFTIVLITVILMWLLVRSYQY